MKYLTFDLGIVNPAFCVIEFMDSSNIKIIALVKDNWKSKPFEKIANIIDKYSPDHIFVEQQPKSSEIKKISFFIKGFCWAKNIKFSHCKPYAYGKHIDSYQDRKKLSVNDFVCFCISNKISLINIPKKIDDVADAFNMCLVEVKKTLLKNEVLY